jgi:hypothetical protein
MMRWVRQCRRAGLSQGGVARMRKGAQTNGAQNAGARTSVGGHGHAIRMVNETAGGQDWLLLAFVIGATQAKLLRARPDLRLTINYPNNEGTTNSSSVRARLKPLKTLA